MLLHKPKYILSEKRVFSSLQMSDLGSNELDQQLLQLAQKLKDGCDEHGRETDCTKSAEILHQLGLLLLKRSPNKLSLIKSVGLFYAAITRQPSNVAEIENDLFDLCQNILELANADKNTKLGIYSKRVKARIQLMRCAVDSKLKRLKQTPQDFKPRIKFVQMFTAAREISIAHMEPPIDERQNRYEAIKNIQIYITNEYKIIMKKVSRFCCKTMGQPPCKFAIAGMGSLARGEITPYSDFEHIILLEIHENYKNNLEYFRWFSVIFHTVILGLQETIIPSLNIEQLNDETSILGNWFFDTCTSGISFDGMMPHACKFPLGRTEHTSEKPWTTELIKPVDEMLEYLSSEKNLKNGYRLKDILMEICYVCGDNDVYEKFKRGIQAHRKSHSHQEIVTEMKLELQKDLDKFSTRLGLVSLQANETINIKQLFYRSSTLFVVALGKIHRIESPSCFNIINKLAEEEKISEKTKINLLFAVSVACEVRLRVYMKEKSQKDHIQLRGNDQSLFEDIVDTVGKMNIVRYFQITYCLQIEIIKQFHLKKAQLYSNPRFLNIAISHALGLDSLTQLMLTKNQKEFGLVAGKKRQSLDPSSQDYFDSTMDLLEAQTKLYDRVTVSAKFDSEKMLRNFSSIATNLVNEQNYDEALEFYKRILEILKHSFLDGKTKKHLEQERAEVIATIRLCIGECLMMLHRYEEARNIAKEFVDNSDFLWLANEDNPNAKVLCFTAGDLLYKLKEFEKSLSFLQLSLAIALSVEANQEKTEQFRMYSGIGACLLFMNQYNDALSYLKIAAEMIEKYQILLDNDPLNVAFSRCSTYSNLGKCLMKLRKFEESLPNLLRGLEAAAEAAVDEEKDETFASILFDTAMCLKHLNRFSQAFNYWQHSLEIRRNLSQTNQMSVIYRELEKHNVKISQDLIMAESLYENDCFTALPILHSKANLQGDEYSEEAARTLFYVGKENQRLNRFWLAIKQFNQSFETQKRLSLTNEICDTRLELLRCYMEVFQRYRAEKILVESFLTEKKLTAVIGKETAEMLTYYLVLDFDNYSLL